MQHEDKEQRKGKDVPNDNSPFLSASISSKTRSKCSSLTSLHAPFHWILRLGTKKKKRKQGIPAHYSTTVPWPRSLKKFSSSIFSSELLPSCMPVPVKESASKKEQAFSFHVHSKKGEKTSHHIQGIKEQAKFVQLSPFVLARLQKLLYTHPFMVTTLCAVGKREISAPWLPHTHLTHSVCHDLRKCPLAFVLHCDKPGQPLEDKLCSRQEWTTSSNHTVLQQVLEPQHPSGPQQPRQKQPHTTAQKRGPSVLSLSSHTMAKRKQTIDLKTKRAHSEHTLMTHISHISLVSACKSKDLFLATRLKQFTCSRAA